MTVSICRMCPTPLRASQGMYCSHRCHSLGQIVLPARHCAQCGRALTRKQLSARARCCSTICSRVVTVPPTPIRDALLGILRGNTHAWMTVSDLAIWVYGFDDPSECEAIRGMVYRLRGMGYVIADRRVTWVPVAGCARAYRLISEPPAVQQEAAA